MINKFYVISIHDKNDKIIVGFHGSYNNYNTADAYCNILVSSKHDICVYILNYNSRYINYKKITFVLNENIDTITGYKTIDRKINDTLNELHDDEIIPIIII